LACHFDNSNWPTYQIVGQFVFLDSTLTCTQADRKFNFQTGCQKKSSSKGIGVLKGGRARLSALQSAAVSERDALIGTLMACNRQLAACKIRVDLTTCAQVPHADP